MMDPYPWVAAYTAAGRLQEAAALTEAYREKLQRYGEMATFRSLLYYLAAVELALAQQDAQAARSLLDQMAASGLRPEDHQIYQRWTVDTLAGQVLTLEGRYAEAEALLRQVLSSIGARADSATWQDPTARARHALGRLLLLSGNAAHARAPLAQAAETFGRTQAPNLSLDQARALALLALAERKLGNHGPARRYEQEVESIWKQHPGIKPRPDDRMAWPIAQAVVAHAH